MRSKISRLLALSEAEVGRKRTKPARSRFKGLNANPRRFGDEWARQRMAACRLMAAVLQCDSDALLAKIGADAETAATYGDAVDWLEREAVDLRKTADRHEIAVARLKSALCRYKGIQRESPGTSITPNTNHAPAAEVAP